MSSSSPTNDPSDLLDQLERRHDQVLQQIDELAERIEKTLLQFKPTSLLPATETGAKASLPGSVDSISALPPSGAGDSSLLGLG